MEIFSKKKKLKKKYMYMYTHLTKHPIFPSEKISSIHGF